MRIGSMGLVGLQKYVDGAKRIFRQGTSGELIVSEAHGRRYEACSRGNLFGYGDRQTAATANSSYVTTSGATAIPFVGVWNPPSSPVLLSILRTQINILSIPAATAGQMAGLFYLYATNQTGLTLGVAPWNLKTLQRTGSNAKAFAATLALTGLTGTLTAMLPVGSSGLTSGNNAGAGVQNPAFHTTPVDEVDGALIVAPGNLLVVMCSDAVTALFASGAMIWEEIPI